MAELGMLVMLIGFVISMAGYAGLLYQAFKNGFLWLLALMFIPFFSFIMLFLDFKNVWKPMLANFAGAVIMQFGMVFLLLGVQSQIEQSPAGTPRPEQEIPAIPGVYIPQETEPLTFLESVDPMLFALMGGIGVFLIVGLLAGGILIGGMSDEEEEEPGTA